MATFAGFPDPQFQGRTRSDFAIVGVPSDLGITYVGGQRLAPHFIREAGHWTEDELFDPRTNFDFNKLKVYDWGDFEITPGDVEQTLKDVEAGITAIMTRAKKLVILGGDDGINYAVLRGVTSKYGVKGPVDLVHLDAHHDTYPRGEHGRKDHGTWVTDVCVDGCVRDLYQIGMRALGNPCSVSSHVESQNITYYDEVAESGLDRVVSQIVGTREDKGYVPAWLAVDIDVVDPAYAPGTAMPEPGGFTSRQIRNLVGILAPYCIGMSITEVLPAKDPQGITSLLANRLVLDFMQYAS